LIFPSQLAFRISSENSSLNSLHLFW
jgi:hypothetical protein